MSGIRVRIRGRVGARGTVGVSTVKVRVSKILLSEMWGSNSG